jgi:hypothetical protein
MPKRKNYPEEQHTVVNLEESDNTQSMHDEISEMRKKINDLYEENEYLNAKQNQFKARSITVGTAFGGVPEVVIRSDGATVHAQMQPTEVVELIEQLAAGIGVEIAMRPKQNFASWRGWEEVIQQRVGFHKIQWKGTAAWQLDGGEVEEKYRYLTGNYIDQLESQDLSLERERVIKSGNASMLPDSQRRRAEYERRLKELQQEFLDEPEEQQLLEQEKPPKESSTKKQVNGDTDE